MLAVRPGSGALMRWWCSAVQQDWDWTPRPYLGVWLLIGAFAALYARMWQLHRRDHEALDSDRRYMWRFAGGALLLWIASDWPVGTLGGGYLASVHMLQYMLYAFGAAPLLMLGTPEWMARSVLEALHLTKVWAALSKPVVAVLLANALLVATHSPIGVDTLRATQVGSFAMDMIWLFSGFVLWAPIINPIREVGMTSPMGRIVYLFLAAALVPMIPGGFITFSSSPLYSTYELAPRVGLSPLHDQQLAGVIMKLGSIPVVWTAMGIIWFRWYNKENERPAHRRAPVKRDPALSPGARKPASDPVDAAGSAIGDGEATPVSSGSAPR
ncbi:MAG: cytochrome c oxidase assembly protein [Microthrixaceae bacterium]